MLFVYKFVYNSAKLLIFNVYCGERGIRTPGASQLNGFQDRRNRPLCHLSYFYILKICSAKVALFIITYKLKSYFLY